MGLISDPLVVLTDVSILLAIGALVCAVVYAFFRFTHFESRVRQGFFALSVLSVFLIGAVGYGNWPNRAWALFGYLIVGPVIVVGLVDVTQKKHSIRRNFPVIGRIRWFFESIRPEIRQYFIESEQEETPFSREKRSVVYARAKGERDTLPFGTKRDVYAPGYEWITHSLLAVSPPNEPPRVRIGGPDVSLPYEASLLNVSAMSYGALSKNAIRALNRAAKLGGFSHNTGEGGLSPYHVENGGDLVWQIGTGYFGCRTRDGRFDLEMFKDRVAQPSVKMVEIKLSQGAKPGHGGILPAAKVTEEIAAIRNVPRGRDVISPPAHTAFDSPLGMMEFIAALRDASGGKPIGFKLCVGHPREFFAICKAILKSGIRPDFVTVDGAEGGTGAAPLEFTNSVGMPLNDGLTIAHNGLVGIGERENVKIIAAGRITTGFHMATKIALGADLCNSARAMMFALGCIQALKCNTNHCPVGVATQDAQLAKALHVVEKSERVAQFQRATIHSFLEMLGAAGLCHPNQLTGWHINRRVSASVIETYEALYPCVEPGALLSEPLPEAYARNWRRADADDFCAPEIAVAPSP